MSFADDFKKKMNEIREGHLQRMADLYGNIAQTNKEIAEYEQMADLYLEMADVENTVENRILKERCEKQLEVYQDLLKKENTSEVVSSSEYKEYVKQITDEYNAKEYTAYVNLLNCAKATIDAMRQINELDAEAHDCYYSLCAAVESSNHGVDYKKEYGNPFAWGFSISRFIEEPLKDYSAIRMIESKIKDLKPYAKTEEESITSEADDK